MHYAHSTDREDRSDWQPLAAHLEAVAGRAETFGARIGLAKPARLAGLLHDLGKYAPRFQARLSGSPERVDHSTAGASLVRETAHGNDRIIAELISYAIAGHHAGLPDRIGPSGSLDERLGSFEAGEKST